MTQPVPFKIVDHDGSKVASNGTLRLTVLDKGGEMYLRRGISGIALKPPGEVVLPLLNELAGDLIANLNMPGEDLVGRLKVLIGQVSLKEPERHEWAVAELDGVRVYTNGVDVILTKRELHPCTPK